MTINGLMTTAELADRLHVTVKAVRKWAKAGCPVASRENSGRGRPSFRFDLKAVRLWLIETGNVNRAMLAVPKTITGGEQAVPVPAAAPTPNDLASENTQTDTSPFTAALGRARKSEEGTFALWAKTLKSDPLSAPAMHARYIAAADALTRMESKKDEILIGEQTMIKTADAFSATAAILSAVRIDLEAMPNAIAPRLAGLTVPEIAAVLREAVQDTLRHISKGKQK